MYPAILNISRTRRVSLMQLGSQSEETLLCIGEQSLSRGASKSAVRRRWLSLCTAWPSHSQRPSEQINFIRTMRLPFSRAGFYWQNIASNKSFSPHTDQICLLATPGFPTAKIAVEKENICECDGHTVHKLSQRHLTVDWLALRESDYSRMHSKVSSDWLPVYIKATRTVLEIFKMVGYFPDSPRNATNMHDGAWYLTLETIS